MTLHPSLVPQLALRCASISFVCFASTPTAAEAGDLTIELGQVVSEGVPWPGAGKITDPVLDEDWYFFQPLLGTLFQFNLLQDNCELEWRCLGVEERTFVFHTQPLCESQPPPFLTEPGEEYKILVNSIDEGIGTYSFVVEQINPIQTFEIELEQVVAQDVPAPGAGAIGKFAEIDRYIFQGKAGQHIYVDSLSGCNGMWRCLDVNSYMHWTLCDGETLTLPYDGQYTLEVISATGQTYAYSFLLHEVLPPQVFSIGIDQLVTLDAPGPGAGHIEEPGNIDHYAFTIEQDTLVCFEQLTGSCNLEWMAWRNDDNHYLTFAEDFCGSQPGEFLLAGPAQYMLQVRVALDGEAGPYSFIIHTGKPADIAPESYWGKGDCRVDVTDLLAVIDQWGVCDQYVLCNADVTGNKIIDVDDLLAVINNWD